MRERNCIFEMMQKKAPVHVQLKGKSVPGLGLVLSVRKHRDCELQGHLHLAGALLGSRLGAELPAHREAEFQPRSKTPPWINSSVHSRGC